MTFVQAVTTGFRKALVFEGRARRPEYWWFFAFVFGGALIIGVIEFLALGGRPFLTRIFQIIVLLPFLAVAWRRLQDTGRPGWWVLIPSALVVLGALVSGSVSRQMFARAIDGATADAGAQAGLVLALSVVQVAAGVVIIWWMSRPSQPGPNAYGPEPRVRK